jgi:hypothetical protein
VNQLWEATFEGLPPKDCSWRFKAASKDEAEAIALRRFREHPVWSARYPTPPPVEVRQVPSPEARIPHNDAPGF